MPGPTFFGGVDELALTWELLSPGRINPERRSMSEQVHSITGAAQGITEDQAPRTRRYLISMGIRTACVIAAIIVPGWPRWVLIAGAVILPYIAVVAANAGQDRRTVAPPSVTLQSRPQLTADPIPPPPPAR